MNKSKVKILIVEDDENQLKNYVAALNFKYLYVLSANNGGDAFNIFRQEEPKIVITDLIMNSDKLDGLNLIKKVKEHSCLTKILVISGYSDIDSIDKAIEMDVAYFLFKPVYLKILFLYLKHIEETLPKISL